MAKPLPLLWVNLHNLRFFQHQALIYETIPNRNALRSTCKIKLRLGVSKCCLDFLLFIKHTALKLHLTNEVNLRRDQNQGLKRCFIAWWRGRKDKNTRVAKQAARKQRKQSFTTQLQNLDTSYGPLMFNQMLCADVSHGQITFRFAW